LVLILLLGLCVLLIQRAVERRRQQRLRKEHTAGGRADSADPTVA